MFGEKEGESEEERPPFSVVVGLSGEEGLSALSSVGALPLTVGLVGAKDNIEGLLSVLVPTDDEVGYCEEELALFPCSVAGALGDDKEEGLFSPLPPLTVGVLEGAADGLLGKVEEG